MKYSPFQVKPVAAILAAGLIAGMVAGCVGVATDAEKAANARLGETGAALSAPLPELKPESTLADVLQYAMQNHPGVEAAYRDWAASVAAITVSRSLPDPRLTFQADVQTTVTSLMPGLMFDFPAPGKLAAGAAAASAESDAKFFVFQTRVLETALEVKRAYYQLYFLEAKLNVNRRMLELLGEVENSAAARNAAGQATLQDVLRAQMERERLATEIANLEDSRSLLLARFAAALGLPPGATPPPIPARFETTTLPADNAALLAAALARNPRLKGMEAEIRQADAMLTLARKARLPDFSAGLEADVKMTPALWRPQAGVTLPLWRDKIAAEIAAAQAGKQAAAARLNAEQIALAVDVAEKSYMIRESGRMLDLLDNRILPKARQALGVARSGYQSGRTGFSDLLDAQRAVLEAEQEAVDTRTRREIALAELDLAVLGTLPPGAPAK